MTEISLERAQLAGLEENHPDVDLRHAGVTVRLITVAPDYYGLSQRDIELARYISAVARELGVPGDSPEDLIDPRARGPSFWFQQMDAPRPQRNRIHLDVWVPHDQAEARIAAAIAAGGHLVTDQYAPSWWVLADAMRPASPRSWPATERRLT